MSFKGESVPLKNRCHIFFTFYNIFLPLCFFKTLLVYIEIFSFLDIFLQKLYKAFMLQFYHQSMYLESCNKICKAWTFFVKHLTLTLNMSYTNGKF